MPPELLDKIRSFRYWDTLKDVIIALIIVVVIIGGIFIYTGNWPPVVVIESDSMQHGSLSDLGVIDTGDLVLVKSIDGRGDVVSYMEGKRTGHETYSEYGDVLIYNKNGYDDITPVIHRALIYLEYNESSGNFDVPELKYHYNGDGTADGWYISGSEDVWYDLRGILVLEDIGYDKVQVSINLGNILNNYESYEIEPHSGFITLGDHNRGGYDQAMLRDEHDQNGNYVGPRQGLLVRPVQPDWVIGKARGELPWFGLIKLYFQDPTITDRAPSNSWTMLWISIFLIFAIPISLDLILIYLGKRKEEEEEEEEEGEEEEEEPPKRGKSDDLDDIFDEMLPPPPPDDDVPPPPPDDEGEGLSPRYDDELPPPPD